MNKATLLGSSLSVLLILLIATMLAHQTQAVTFATISNQMGVGATGTDVTNLQTFLASNANIYPEGRITGYYGPLTAKAVAQFQLAYNLPAVGRVGPLTLAKINSVITTGYGLDIYAPTISNITVNKTQSSITVNWSTNETTQGRVHYSTAPFVIREAGLSFAEPEIIGGSSVSGQNMQSSQSLTINGLQTNTLYYYIILAKDASGNVSVTPQATVITN